MFENTLQTNGKQSWKWVTISGRVFVDNVELDENVEASRTIGVNGTQDEVFESLAKSKLRELFPTDEPFKLDSFDFA